MDTHKLESKCMEIWEMHHDIDVLQKLIRTEGGSKLDAIRLTRKVCGIPLGTAKRYVNDSKVWVDTRQASEDFEKQVFDILSNNTDDS